MARFARRPGTRRLTALRKVFARQNRTRRQLFRAFQLFENHQRDELYGAKVRSRGDEQQQYR